MKNNLDELTVNGEGFEWAYNESYLSPKFLLELLKETKRLVDGGFPLASNITKILRDIEKEIELTKELKPLFQWFYTAEKIEEVNIENFERLSKMK